MNGDTMKTTLVLFSIIVAASAFASDEETLCGKVDRIRSISPAQTTVGNTTDVSGGIGLTTKKGEHYFYNTAEQIVITTAMGAMNRKDVEVCITSTTSGLKAIDVNPVRNP
jgi:hypothetical protein